MAKILSYVKENMLANYLTIFIRVSIKNGKAQLPTFEEALMENYLFIKEFMKKITKKTYILKIT